MTGTVEEIASSPNTLGSVVRPGSAAVAVRQRDNDLSYAALHRRAAGITIRLRRQGVPSVAPVGICCTDALVLVSAIIGVLRADRAYLPIDPSWPLQRVRSAATRTGLGTIVTDSKMAARLALPHVDLVNADEVEPTDPEDQPGELRPSGPAYMILTSGSTGEPKAVTIGHDAAVASLRARREVYRRPVRRFLWHSPSAFDSSVAGLFWTLADGGMLVVPAAHERADPARLLDLVRTNDVSHVLCLPRVWREILRLADPADLRSVETVIVAGEAVPAALVAEHVATCRAELWNEYGPAEAAVWATAQRCDQSTDQEDVPIGRARPGVAVHVVRPDLTECDSGESGEILLSGPALAWGYTGAPGLSAERFVPAPFAAGARAYRTGDLGVRRPDGLLEFRGRVDNEVKISGIRVAPAEVERALLAVPGVVEAVVVARQAGQGRAALIGHLIMAPGSAAGSSDTGRIRAALDNLLPATMIPAELRVHAELPRGANGKVDRAALLEARPAEAATVREAASNDSPYPEVVAAWRSALRDDDLSGDTDLFAAGGDSITAVMICAELRERGLAAEPYDVFRERTPRRLARLLAGRVRPDTDYASVPVLAAADGRLTDGRVAEETAASPSPWLPLTPVQRWFVATHADRLHHWNFSVGLTLDGGDPDLVRAALTRTVERHAMLAAVFACSGDQADPHAWRMRPGARTVPLVLEFLDDPYGDEASARIQQWQGSLDLCNGPVARLLWLESKTAPRRTRAVLIAHHMVTDAVSTHVILNDLAAELSGRGNGRAPHISDWIRAQQAHIDTGGHDSEAHVWCDLAALAATPLTDDPPGTEGDAGRVTIRVAGSAAAAFRAATRVRPRAAEEILLAALVMAVRKRFPRVRTLGVELETAGRSTVPASGVGAVGWFTAFHPVALALDDTEDPRTARARASTALAEVPGADGLGFLALAYGERRVGAGLAAMPPPSIGLNYLGRVENTFAVVGTELSVDPAPPGARAAAAPRRHVIDLDAFLSGDELVLTWTYPTIGAMADEIHELAARVAVDVQACLEAEVSDENG